MELLINTIKDILNEDLTLLERGILISILLCKDEDKRIVLAKFKITCNINKIKPELVSLHERGYIKWSGYKAAKKSLENSRSKDDIINIIEFMNNLYNRKFDPNSSSSTTHLRNRLENNSIDDIKLVISNRYKEWKDDPMMEKHLNPTTIFRPSKFDKYLEEAKRTRVGESFVAANNSNLEHGDEITSKNVKSFALDDTYNIKIYQCSDGNIIGNGMHATRYGRDIMRMLKMQKFNSVRTHRYFYVQK